MRIPVRLLAVLGLLLILPLTGCNKLRARDELNKGVRAYKAASYEEAEDHFRRGVPGLPGKLWRLHVGASPS